MKKFNYDAVDLLDDYEFVEEIPIEVLKQLNVFSRNPEVFYENKIWLEENLEAIKSVGRDLDDLEDDVMNSMYPEGHDPDIDGNILDD